MTSLQEQLFAFRDPDYALFTAKLTPGIPVDHIIGIRVPQLRKFAKSFRSNPLHEAFLQQLPHAYFDENMLHGLLISQMKDMDTCLEATDQFLPYVDNWAVCDIMSPKVFAKDKDRLMEKIREWSASEHTYTCRFGLEMLMTHFLDADFCPEYLKLPAAVQLEDYYAKMMVSWFFATALAKQWDATIGYIEERKLSPWIHKKTIQKACESFRITPDQKVYLKTLK